ncbi:MAG: HupE/UreJ family protein [Pseudomonadota bacterium]
MALNLLVLSGLSTGVWAHELEPAVGRIWLEEGQVRLEIEASFEAIVAGVDLGQYEDTNAAPQAEDYDALLAMPASIFQQRLEAFWPVLRNNIAVKIGSSVIAPDLVGVKIGDQDNPELARKSTLLMTVPNPGNKAVAAGWSAAYGPMILRQEGIGDAGFTGYLNPGELSPEISPEGGGTEGGMATFLRYIGVGFEHIIPLGLDHILFVLGLYFLAPKLSALLWQISAFTLAHTITLALAATGLVNIPGSIVEPLIAASIVYVAVENIFFRELKPWRPALIFAFGLLHGLGFAGVLGEFGLPPGQFVPALIGFNIGVEFGQIAVILVVLAFSLFALQASEGKGFEATALYGYYAVGLLFLVVVLVGRISISPDWDEALPYFLLAGLILAAMCATCVAASSTRFTAYRDFVSVPASVIIAIVGAFWVIERVFLGG